MSMVSELGWKGMAVAIAVLLFFVSGAEAVLGFLHSDVAHEVLGSIATLLALIVAFVVDGMSQSSSTRT